MDENYSILSNYASQVYIGESAWMFADSVSPDQFVNAFCALASSEREVEESLKDRLDIVLLAKDIKKDQLQPDVQNKYIEYTNYVEDYIGRFLGVGLDKAELLRYALQCPSGFVWDYLVHYLSIGQNIEANTLIDALSRTSLDTFARVVKQLRAVNRDLYVDLVKEAPNVYQQFVFDSLLKITDTSSLSLTKFKEIITDESIPAEYWRKYWKLLLVDVFVNDDASGLREVANRILDVTNPCFLDILKQYDHSEIISELCIDAENFPHLSEYLEKQSGEAALLEQLQESPTLSNFDVWLGSPHTFHGLISFLEWYASIERKDLKSLEYQCRIEQMIAKADYIDWGDTQHGMLAWLQDNQNEEIKQLVLRGYASVITVGQVSSLFSELCDNPYQYGFSADIIAKMMQNKSIEGVISREAVKNQLAEYCSQGAKIRPDLAVRKTVSHLIAKDANASNYKVLAYILNYSEFARTIVSMSDLRNYKANKDQTCDLMSIWFKLSCQNFGYFIRQFVSWVYAVIVVGVGFVSVPAACALSPLLALSLCTNYVAMRAFKEQSFEKEAQQVYSRSV